MLNVVVEAAQKAGEVLAHYFEMTALEREVKDDKSFCTRADRESEEIIVSILKKTFPGHGIVGEEGTNHNPNTRLQWIIDPLDGTNNFVNGIPLFAVSIALLENNTPILSVVYNPITRSLYSAEKGNGMIYNGKSARVSDQTADAGIVGFGPGGKEGKQKLDRIFTNATLYFKSKRYLGATALELAYLARGGTEAFICLGLKKWDYAGGALLIQEAGGTITDFQGKPWTLDQNFFIASNGVAHNDLIKVMQTIA